MSDSVNIHDTQIHSDFSDASLAIPANKLDADQYSADDIDGVTESIFGSGNMAYASLQASQTDALIALNEAAGSESGAPAQEGFVFAGSAATSEGMGST